MDVARHRGWLAVLGATSLAAWSMLMLGSGDLTLAALCSAAQPWAASWPSSLNFALVLGSPGRLAADWTLMFAAMMPALVIVPLRHVHERSFARRRTRSMGLFFAGYWAVWLAAGMLLEAMALAILSVAPAPLIGLGLVAAVAILWQVSPAKQWCLNRCHRQPQLAAFGAAADRDALRFGLANGAACVGGCWALMLLVLAIGHGIGSGHVAAMMIATFFVVAERLESPAPLAWRWRGCGKALRILKAHARIWPAAQSGIGAVSP